MPPPTGERTAEKDVSMSELMTDGRLCAVAPDGWTVVHDGPWTDDIFSNDTVNAVAYDQAAEPVSQPHTYIGQRTWGSLKDFAETILSWEQYELCLPDDFSQIEWIDTQVGELQGYRFAPNCSSKTSHPCRSCGYSSSPGR